VIRQHTDQSYTVRGAIEGKSQQSGDDHSDQHRGKARPPIPDHQRDKQGGQRNAQDIETDFI
jgi:hypothetical protein